MCLFFSNPLIHECWMVHEEELLAATVTPQRAHFLEARHLFSALPLLYGHCPHLVNLSESLRNAQDVFFVSWPRVTRPDSTPHISHTDTCNLVFPGIAVWPHLSQMNRPWPRGSIGLN